MKTDAELKSDAITLLREQLGLVETERFLALIQREQFDYTQWRQGRWLDMSIGDLANQARGLRSEKQAQGG